MKEQKQAEAAAAKAEAAAKADKTLGRLLETYADHLQQQGRASAVKVRASLRLHVAEAFPRLWGKPAVDVDEDDVMTILERVKAEGKHREAAKLRAYLRAAYGQAMKARRTVGHPMRALGISSNPVSDVALDETGAGSGVRDRALSVDELRAYWRRIATMDDAGGALLRFHLLTGAQRIEQLARLTAPDFDHDTMAVTLRDPKGRRKQARPHVVPMIPAAAAALDAMGGGKRTHAPYLFSVDGGLGPAAYYTLQHRVRAIAEAMVEAGEAKAPFTPGDLRRTVETRLAAKGVSLEVRAQLQSHGLGGLQAKHYDRHDYMDEKREALEILHDLVTGTPGTVTPLRRKAG